MESNSYKKMPNNIKNIWQQSSITNKIEMLVSTNNNFGTSSTYKNNLTQSSSIFKKYILKDANVAYSSDVIETTLNNYVIIGQTFDTVSVQLQWRLTLIGIDQNYNQVWKKSYGNNNFNYTHYLFDPNPLIKKEGFLYSTLIVQDSNYKQPGVFIKFNFNGGTIWQKNTISIMMSYLLLQYALA